LSKVCQSRLLKLFLCFLGQLGLLHQLASKEELALTCSIREVAKWIKFLKQGDVRAHQ